MIYLSSFEVEQQIDHHEKIKDVASLTAFCNYIKLKYNSVKQMCAIIHDKDTNKDGSPKATHFHIFVKMGTSQSIEWISKIFEVQEQYINKIEGKWKDALAYATHLNAPGKHQYEPTELVLINMTIDQYNERAKTTNLSEQQTKQALFDYGDMKMSKKELFSKWINTSQAYAKYKALYQQMKEYRMEVVKERQMKVIYITGQSESGKTTLAKFLASTQNYDYFVSGSGTDLLDGYDKEECIILDDIRCDAFSKADLFKLTDNHTNSSVKSRFKNKDISNCKLMILTSVYAPHELYDWTTDSVESFKQLSRRLGYEYVLIDGKKCYEVVYDKDFDILNNQKFRSKIMDFDMNMVFSVLGIQQAFGNSDFWSQITAATLEQVKKDSQK